MRVTNLTVSTISATNNQHLFTEELVHRTFQLMKVTPNYPTIVTVEFTQTEEMDGALGWCEEIDDHEINIQIDKSISDEEFQPTIVHEAVHATQTVQGLPFCDEEAYKYENRI